MILFRIIADFRVLPKRARGKLELSMGMKGTLITTNDKEKLCISEAYNLLNEVDDRSM